MILSTEKNKKSFWIQERIKHILRTLFPEIYSRCRDRYNSYARLTKIVIRRQGLAVANGPFSGMRYLSKSYGSMLIPKLIGSYEIELHHIISDIIASRPKVIVDVGCAEGYYAVGLARAIPKATVYAYDISEESRELCRQLATLNGVEKNIIIREFCDSDEFNTIPLDGAFIMCDCEGYELELFISDNIQKIENSFLLIELHDCFVPGITPELVRRFEKTHVVRLIDIKERNITEYPVLRGISKSMRRIALYERDTNTTPPQQWAYMIPRNLT